MPVNTSRLAESPVIVIRKRRRRDAKARKCNRTTNPTAGAEVQRVVILTGTELQMRHPVADFEEVLFPKRGGRYGIGHEEGTPRTSGLYSHALKPRLDEFRRQAVGWSVRQSSLHSVTRKVEQVRSQL